MPITEDRALEILSELIRKPESRAEDIPRIWGEILTTYAIAFAPPADPVKRRRRRRAGPTSPNRGWPAGVSQAEYKMWKEARQAQGFTENLNPQEYKRIKDAGRIGQAMAAMTSKPATKGKRAK